MSTSRCFIGIDGGGTHTRAVRADESGRVLGAGHAGSTNRNHYPRDVLAANLRQAMVATGLWRGCDLRAIFLGMCGVSTEADRRDIISIVGEITEVPRTAKVVVENDTHTGLVGGLSGRPGIVLIAGTGSACLGVSADGRHRLCGGWGALADDAGSAPWIGVKAIEAAVRSEDGRLGPTALRDIVFRFLELSDPRQLIDRVHNRGLEREEIGRLAPLVIQAAQAGDAVAADIVQQASAQLSQLVGAVAGPLFGDSPCEVLFVGGVARSGPPFQPMLAEQIARDTPTARVIEPEMPPVKGAVLEALRLDGVPWTPQCLANLRAGAISEGE